MSGKVSLWSDTKAQGNELAFPSPREHIFLAYGQTRLFWFVGIDHVANHLVTCAKSTKDYSYFIFHG